MYRLKMMTAAVVLATVSAPSHAFMETLILGLTSVTNNLIDSTESVTNNTIDAASDGFQTVASGPGLMADRIGVMADRIGFMADRIVTTEGLIAGLAHKLIDVSQTASRTASMPGAGGPLSQGMGLKTVAYDVAYGAGPGARHGVVEAVSYPAPAAGHGYSASSMIYGVQGATYTATTPAAQGYHAGQLSLRGQPHMAGQLAVGQGCKVAYGVPLKC